MEGFFQSGSSLDDIEIEELLAFRYKSIDFIMKKNVHDGILFINQAIEKNKEEKLFMQWVVQLPIMDKESYISFNNYKDKLTGKNIVTKSQEEILEECEKILQKERGMKDGS